MSKVKVNRFTFCGERSEGPHGVSLVCEGKLLHEGDHFYIVAPYHISTSQPGTVKGIECTWPREDTSAQS